MEEEEEEAELGGGDREGGTQFHVEMVSHGCLRQLAVGEQLFTL